MEYISKYFLINYSNAIKAKDTPLALDILSSEIAGLIITETLRWVDMLKMSGTKIDSMKVSDITSAFLSDLKGNKKLQDNTVKYLLHDKSVIPSNDGLTQRNIADWLNTGLTKIIASNLESGLVNSKADDYYKIIKLRVSNYNKIKGLNADGEADEPAPKPINADKKAQKPKKRDYTLLYLSIALAVGLYLWNKWENEQEKLKNNAGTGTNAIPNAATGNAGVGAAAAVPSGQQPAIQPPVAPTAGNVQPTGYPAAAPTAQPQPAAGQQFYQQPAPIVL